VSGKRFPGGPGARFQRGFALIAILALVALISAFLIASALNRSSADISNEREDRSMSALRQAKAALIAYAAAEQWQDIGGATQFQPGALPCPDRDNDGIAEDHEFPQKPCDTALKRIGRFPWKTVGADDLRDASGERLWYAVSANFLKNTPSYTNIINSDTPGQLTVTGTAAANNVIAVLFAPGAGIQNQFRDPANAVTFNDPANFLEQFDSTTYATFSSNSFPTNALNDRVLVIMQDDLMSAVEPIVAGIIERDIRPNIQAYFNDWNAYPFPATFDPTRTQSQFVGNAGTLTPGFLAKGLLPVSRSALQWRTSSISITQIPGGTGSGASGPSGGPCPGWASNCTLDSVNCGASSTSQIVCQVSYSGTGSDRPAIRIQAILEGAALSFPTLLGPDDAAMVDWVGNPLSSGSGYGNWSQSGSNYPLVHPPNTANTLATSPVDGTAQVVFTGRLQNPDTPPTGTGGTVTITINVPAYQPFTNPLDANLGWFAANEWFRQTYFAVSAGFLPGGGNSCNPLPSPPSSPPLCLQVNNLRPSYANAKDKQVIVVLAGRSLSNSARPSTNLPDYFESANLTAAQGSTMIFENRAGNPTTINDRVVVISP
jgi:type II secretory pathway pseudopilin PulG